MNYSIKTGNRKFDIGNKNVGWKKITIIILMLIIEAFIMSSCLFNGKEEDPRLTTYMIEMRDGVHLATDVYLPDKTGCYPIILYRTPYNKDTDMGPINLLTHGVGVVVQDSRGCNASEGVYEGFGTDGEDAYDTVAWMKEQSWFNGKYATYGGSARGITQYMQVPYLGDLSAQYIEVATPDLFSNALFQGGAPRKMLAENWLNGIEHGDYYQTIFQDMDADGDFAKAHRIDSSQYSNVTWPAIHRGGWFDCFGQGIVDGFMGYQYSGGEGGKGNSKLIMGPWTHELDSNVSGNLVFPDNAKTDPWSSKIFEAMFAEQLLGRTDVGDYRTMPNVTYYVMGDTLEASPLWNKWAISDNWPIEHNNQAYYLQADGTLGTSIPSESNNFSYNFDPSNPVTTLGGANLVTNNRGSFDQSSVENGRSDMLHFEIPITEPLLVTGQITANLFVTSDCVDTDFTVKLMDVYPDGSSWIIADGIVRMRYRDGMSEELFMDGSDETIYEAMVDLWSTSYYFNEGHTLRISISSSNYPRFDVNPNTGATITPVTTATPYNIAHNTIVVSSAYPSALILPIPTSSPNYIYND